MILHDGLRTLVERNSRLFNFLVLFLVVHQVKGQFNLNPSSKGRESLDRAPEDRHFVDQLQSHRITDDQHKPADQLVESHTIRVEESTRHSPPTIYNTSPTNPTNPTNPTYYDSPASTHSTTYVTSHQTNGLTNPTLGSTAQSIGSSTSVVTVGSAASTGTAARSLPGEMGRLQSTTPGQFAGGPHDPNNPQMAYSPNRFGDPMGSPSLISSIFSKFNHGGQMGYHPNYYGSGYGSGAYPPSMYGAGYPPSMYGAMGNPIMASLYAKMNSLRALFHRLTSKFQSPYNPNAFYGGEM